jgi:hypothetical protein
MKDIKNSKVLLYITGVIIIILYSFDPFKIYAEFPWTIAYTFSFVVILSLFFKFNLSIWIFTLIYIIFIVIYFVQL